MGKEKVVLELPGGIAQDCMQDEINKSRRDNLILYVECEPKQHASKITLSNSSLNSRAM